VDPLQKVKEDLAQEVSSALSKLGLGVRSQDVEISDQAGRSFGDLSTPIVIKTVSSSGKNPVETAERAAQMMGPVNMVRGVEALRGYLNFHIDWPSFAKRLVEEILSQGEDFGRPKAEPGTLVLEHTSVNPTGPLNIARSRNSIIGDALFRLYSFLGWKVRRLYLLNDIGHQIVVIYWGMRKGISSQDLRKRYSRFSAKKDFITLFTYVPASAEVSENPVARLEVARLEAQVHSDPKLLKQLRQMSRACLEGQLETLSKLGIEFDEITPESRFVEEGSLPDILDRLRERGVLVEERDGSVGLDLSSVGLTRRKSGHVTLLKSDGSSTYTLRDIAYHEWKFREGDLFITVLGEDHKREFKELEAILRMLGHRKDLRAAFYSFVTYEAGKKMSTRRGETVPLDEVIEEALSRSEEEVRKRREELDPDKVRSIAEQVGLGAIKFNILKVDTNKSIRFKWEEAINFAGDSSAYVQYAHARASSILKKAGDFRPRAIDSLCTKEEKDLIWSIARIPAVIVRSAESMKPNYLAEHAILVASNFNKFYMQHRVIQADEPLRSARLALVACVKHTLAQMLGLLGIAAPEEI